MRVNRRLLRFAERLMLFFTAAVILREALISTPIANTLISDNLLHAIAFYVLALLADLSFPEKKYIVLNVTGLFLFGVSIELLQRYVGIGRHVSLIDVVANAAGISLFYLSRPALKRNPLFSRFWLSAQQGSQPRPSANGSSRHRVAGKVRTASMLEGITVPERLAAEFRYMRRYLRRLAGEEARLKEQLGTLLTAHGSFTEKELGDGSDRCSGAALRRLGELHPPDPQVRKSHSELLGKLRENRRKQARLLRDIRQMARQERQRSVE